MGHPFDIDLATTGHSQAAGLEATLSDLEAQIGIGRDARGLAINTPSRPAAQAFERALWRMLSYYGDPLADCDSAIIADPGWALPQVLKAVALAATSEQAHTLAAQAVLREALACGRQANHREQAHLGAAQACVAGDWAGACERWQAILVDHPLDLMALLAAHLFDFFRGDSVHLRRRVAGVLPAWSPNTPLYSYVLGLHAFGLEENHQYAEAEQQGRHALSLQRHDPWAVHAVTHVMEMQGRHEEGCAWLQERRHDWAPDNGFAFHNWWHLALFQLERLDIPAVLALYDEHLKDAADFVMQRVDAAALLWRLRLLGVDVGERWRALAPRFEVRAPEAGHYVFNDLHALLAQIGSADTPRAVLLMRAATLAAQQPDHPRKGAQQTGLTLLQAFVDHAVGDHDSACDALLALRQTHAVQAIGGSHAQRDLVTQTLLDAALRAGRHALARHLLNERRFHKPDTALTAHWAARIQ